MSKLKTMAKSKERQTGGKPKPSTGTTVTKLADLGVSRDQSSRWQQLADERDVLLSLSELQLYVDDADVAADVLRVLRIPVFDPARPPRVPLRCLERVLRRRLTP
jgi:hypothetical protein